MTTDIVFLRDEDWSAIDAELCRVKVFTPMVASVEDGRVTATAKSLPYAAIEFECEALSQNATGFITHKIDFLHLWEAFSERGVGEDEEVLFFWTRKNLRRWARLVSRAMPKLWVLIYPKHAYDLMLDEEFMPELSVSERVRMTRPIVDWKPEVMV